MNDISVIGSKRGGSRRSTLKTARAVLRDFVKMSEGLLEFFVTGATLTAANEEDEVKATASAPGQQGD